MSESKVTPKGEVGFTVTAMSLLFCSTRIMPPAFKNSRYCCGLTKILVKSRTTSSQVFSFGFFLTFSRKPSTKAPAT